MDEHAVDAIVEDLTTELSRYAGLRITARNLALTYKGKPVDIQRAGQELGVRYAVEGSVRKLDGALRVNAQLVSAETGEQFWAERFTVEPDATGDGVDLVVWRIAYLVERRMFETESARSMRERPDHPDATDALVRAHALYNMPPSPQKQTQLVGLYERAVELDPSSAPALAGLAEALLDGLPAVSSDDPTVPAKLRRTEELVSRAELLDPNEMHVMFARTYLLGTQGRCTEAIPAARRAIEAHPNRPGTEQWFGICLLRDGRAAEAVRHFEQAIRVNPRSHELDNRYRYMGQALLASRAIRRSHFLVPQGARGQSESPCPDTRLSPCLDRCRPCTFGRHRGGTAERHRSQPSLAHAHRAELHAVQDHEPDRPRERGRAARGFAGGRGARQRR